MDDDTGVTATERMAATYSLLRTLRNTDATQEDALTQIEALKRRDLLDESQLGNFIASLPHAGNGDEKVSPGKVIPLRAVPELPSLEDPLSGEQVLALRSSPIECAPTGFDPIDTRVRGGGLPRGTLSCFVGPPESGKTRLLCQVALGLSQTLPVFLLLTDWGRSAAIDIMAVMEGFDPKKIDEDPVGARDWWKIKTRGRVIFFLNDNNSLANAFDIADTFGHCAILLDSIQTVSPEGIPGIERAAGYEKNRLIARYIRGRLRPTDLRPQAHTCIFTSEANRSAFAARAKEDRSTEIAAAMGGGIEYASDLLVMLNRPEGESEQRTLTFAKNRYRPYLNPLPRSITVDYLPTGHLAEVPEEEAARIERSAYEATLLPAKRVLREVLSHGSQSSFRKFRSAVQAADPSIKDRLFAKVVEVMEMEKSIVVSEGPRNSSVYSLSYEDEPAS